MNVKSAGLLDVIWSGLLLASLLEPGARADTMLTKFTTFMRAGPAKEFAVTDEIPTQAAVDRQGCANDWCQVRYGGAYGWVEQKLLSASPPMARPQPGARPTECFDFVRTGWPDAGNLDGLCIYSPQGGMPSPETKKPGG